MSKNKLFLTIVGMLVVTGAWRLSSNVEVGLTTDALAVTGASITSAACTDPTVAGYVADLALTATWNAASVSAAATPGTAGAVLGNPVHSQANPTVTATLNGTNVTAGFLLLTLNTPDMKLAGLQCQATANAATLTIYSNDGVTDGAGAEFAIGNVADADGTWTAADKIDALASAGPADVFGATTPRVATLLPTDAGGDAAANGEVLLTGNEANGLSEFKVMVDVVNYNPAAGTDVETFTYTLAGSN